MFCHSCGHEIELVGGIGRRDTCPKCEADLHCCLNCTYYDTTKANDCAEPGADWVADKIAANFCEYFEPTSRGTTVAAKAVSKEEVKNAFEALFKKS